MDARRIEEFRKKLREGRPVRVVGGQVLLDSEPAGKARADGDAPGGARADSTPAAPRPDGVLMKPHQWGAEPAAAEPFYATDAGHRRALAEQALLAEHYPGFAMDVDDDGTPYVHGWIGPNAQLRERYHLLVELPPGYGRGVMPRAWLLEPPLRAGAPHVFRDGSLCLDHSGAFTGRSTLLTFLAWTSVWLVLYEGWLETGQAW